MLRERIGRRLDRIAGASALGVRRRKSQNRLDELVVAGNAHDQRRTVSTVSMALCRRVSSLQ
jgi:hypothetical protein